MAQRLKRWESPRREGRNHKGRGGSARQRQKQKQMKALRQRLKQDSPSSTQDNPSPPGRECCSLPFFITFLSLVKSFALPFGQPSMVWPYPSRLKFLYRRFTLLYTHSTILKNPVEVRWIRLLQDFNSA